MEKKVHTEEKGTNSIDEAVLKNLGRTNEERNQQSHIFIFVVVWFVLHVVVWNPPDDWTGTPHKMSACLSVHEFYTAQLVRPESSFFCME